LFNSADQDRVAHSSPQLAKENKEIAQRCQDLEKAKAIAETKLQYEVPRAAELERSLQLAQNDLLARNKLLATHAAQINQVESRLQLENGKLERAAERTRELEDTVRQLRADVQARVLQDEGLIARYQDDNLVSERRPMRQSVLMTDFVRSRRGQ
jgi:chromosome segregation ATPase